MLSDFSSNVVFAKVRAMYGKRIRACDYNNLLNCKTVGEIAAYLKNKTAYSKVLGKVNESNVHRGELEALLKNKMFNDFATLCRYELSTGESFSEYVIGRAEVEQIIRSLVYILSHNKSKGSDPIPSYFDKHTKINLKAMSRAENYEEFLKALGNSPYRKLLKNLSLKYNEQINLSQVESILYDYLYERVLERLRQNTNKKIRIELKSIFETYIDFGNFVRIIRTKQNNSSQDFAILKHGKLKSKYIEAMLMASKEKELFDIMESTNQGKKLKNLKYSYIDQIPLKVVYDKCRRYVHSSINASLVMLSYIFLIHIELNNIINVIEGIRYQMPKEDIEELLILK
ncbi:MAG: V-type ATP synthase subunit C [Eubacteriales bacterium SKADARSKE-1]|nr:V-type ATP synthase subunit C [Eubacteriales bacterium SKADARSKE-1]